MPKRRKHSASAPRKVDTEAIKRASPQERARLSELALGRLGRLLSRPFKEGDVEQYEMVRAVIMALHDGNRLPDYQPNYTRDRNKGAAGD